MLINEKLVVPNQHQTWKCYVPSDAEDIFVPARWFRGSFVNIYLSLDGISLI
jgi:hypothetical protein